jgi:hypothetical protein
MLGLGDVRGTDGAIVHCAPRRFRKPQRRRRSVARLRQGISTTSRQAFALLPQHSDVAYILAPRGQRVALCRVHGVEANVIAARHLVQRGHRLQTVAIEAVDVVDRRVVLHSAIAEHRVLLHQGATRTGQLAVPAPIKDRLLVAEPAVTAVPTIEAEQRIVETRPKA